MCCCFFIDLLLFFLFMFSLRYIFFPLFDSFVDSRQHSEDDHRREDAFGGLVGHGSAAFEDRHHQGEPDGDGGEGDAPFDPSNDGCAFRFLFLFHPAILT